MRWTWLPESQPEIFSGFYSIDSGPALVQVAGVAEVLLGAALAVGLLRVFTAWVALAANLVSTGASWKQILDPWGLFGLTDGGTHLFLASLVIMAVSIVLVINARDDTATLDRRLGISPRRETAPRSPATKAAHT
jgi:uncharacterized membrane protein YphA (DoxX/SURF4 family)